ncbi:small heat shock protein, chloroplastic-like [Triticum urartu]|uniref:SHSP domain-containing protein n=1 Tax=Triticum urartu TaxID=4572 RepID=A0A8R7QED0_TRIUA|nr:small heat shock protein, chloroplastic-like [Triticum urartu]
MSTVISCSLLSGRPAAAPSRSSGNRFPPTTGKAAAVALPCFQRQSRPSSVCCASNPKGDQHVPKTDLPPFSISPVALLRPGSPQGERWQIKEGPEAVSMWFEVPGLSKEDLVVELDEDVLVIRKMKAKAETAAGTTDAGGSASSKDAAGAAVQDGDMYARLLVPAGYNKETAKAELASGVLKVTIDKVKELARRRISVDIDVK